jgi:hypothetical protein
MLITPFPSSFPLNTSNQSVEAARRENNLRETIPQSGNGEAGEREQGLGSEGDRARQAAGQSINPLTYERPTPQSLLTPDDPSTESQLSDNANDQSAGREDAEQRQQDQAEQAEIRELEARDREVRAHEQAHAAVGGQYAGSPQYEFETGPDGQRYAVGGEVSIDVSEERTPEQTVRKLQQVRAAALAPAEPSPQDLRVAAEAARGVAEAQAQINRESNEAAQVDTETQTGVATSPPSLDEIIDENDISTPTRTLDNATLQIDDEEQTFFNRRNRVISQFYQRAAEPQAIGFSTSA